MGAAAGFSLISRNSRAERRAEHLRRKDERIRPIHIGHVDVVRGLVDRRSIGGKNVEVELNASGVGVEHGRLIAHGTERRTRRAQFPFEQDRPLLRRHTECDDRRLRRCAALAPDRRRLPCENDLLSALGRDGQAKPGIDQCAALEQPRRRRRARVRCARQLDAQRRPVTAAHPDLRVRDTRADLHVIEAPLAGV